MFAVLYVAVMGLTTVFYIYICSFSTEFILDAYYCTSLFTVLQKKTNGSHTGILLTVVVIINTSFADAKYTFAYLSHSTGELHEN